MKTVMILGLLLSMAVGCGGSEFGIGQYCSKFCDKGALCLLTDGLVSPADTSSGLSSCRDSCEESARLVERVEGAQDWAGFAETVDKMTCEEFVE